MSDRVLSFSHLHHLLCHASDSGQASTILARSLADARALVESFEPLRRLAGSPPGRVDDELLWDVFALSVVDDLLICDPTLRAGVREDFFSSLGFEPFSDATTFSPLTCEVVAVSNDDVAPEAGIVLERDHWSGLRFGELVFARCAKSVRCHPSLGIVSGVADASMLHFTNRRPGRKVNDLSHGWGGNSRRRTSYRRFYDVDGIAFYNVDAALDIGLPRPALRKPGHPPADLDVDQARELLMHRGFVQTPRFEDEWPYDWRMAMRDSQSTWPFDVADLLPFDAALREAGIA